MENDADGAVPSEKSLQPWPLRLRSEPALNAVEGVNSVEGEESRRMPDASAVPQQC
jgi:hypothetical protein